MAYNPYGGGEEDKEKRKTPTGLPEFEPKKPAAEAPDWMPPSARSIYEKELAAQKAQPPAEESGILEEAAKSLTRGVVVEAPKTVLRVAGFPLQVAAPKSAPAQAVESAIESLEKWGKQWEMSPSVQKDPTENPEVLLDPKWWAARVPEQAGPLLMTLGGGLLMRVGALAKYGTMLKAAQVAGDEAKIAEIGALLGKAQNLGTLGAGMALELGEAADRMANWEKNNPDKPIHWGTKLVAGLGTGVIAGSLEAYSVNRLFGKPEGKALVNKVIDSILTESSTEGAQTLVENFFQKWGYDPSQKMTEGLVESMLIGAVLGGGFGTVETYAERKAGRPILGIPDLTKEQPPPAAPGVEPTPTPMDIRPPEPGAPPAAPVAPTPAPLLPTTPDFSPVIFQGNALGDILAGDQDIDTAIPKLAAALDGNLEKAERFFGLWRRGDAKTALQEFPEFAPNEHQIFGPSSYGGTILGDIVGQGLSPDQTVIELATYMDSMKDAERFYQLWLSKDADTALEEFSAYTKAAQKMPEADTSQAVVGQGLSGAMTGQEIARTRRKDLEIGRTPILDETGLPARDQFVDYTPEELRYLYSLRKPEFQRTQQDKLVIRFGDSRMYRDRLYFDDEGEIQLRRVSETPPPPSPLMPLGMVSKTATQPKGQETGVQLYDASGRPLPRTLSKDETEFNRRLMDAWEKRLMGRDFDLTGDEKLVLDDARRRGLISERGLLRLELLGSPLGVRALSSPEAMPVSEAPPAAESAASIPLSSLPLGEETTPTPPPEAVPKEKSAGRLPDLFHFTDAFIYQAKDQTKYAGDEGYRQGKADAIKEAIGDYDTLTEAAEDIGTRFSAMGFEISPDLRADILNFVLSNSGYGPKEYTAEDKESARAILKGEKPKAPPAGVPTKWTPPGVPMAVPKILGKVTPSARPIILGRKAEYDVASSLAAQWWDKLDHDKRKQTFAIIYSKWGIQKFPPNKPFAQLNKNQQDMVVEAYQGLPKAISGKEAPIPITYEGKKVGGKGQEVVLIQCAKTKIGKAAPAKDLYTSDLFKKAKAYAENRGLPYLILSAEHGLVRPDQIIEPYDKTLHQMPQDKRKAWADKVSLQIRAYVHEGSDLTFLAGETYAGDVVPQIGKYFEGKINRPLQGKGIGEQLRWLGENAATPQKKGEPPPGIPKTAFVPSLQDRLDEVADITGINLTDKKKYPTHEDRMTALAEAKRAIAMSKLETKEKQKHQKTLETAEFWLKENRMTHRGAGAVLPADYDVVERYQWMANKEGGQKYGNQMVIVRLSPKVYDAYARSKMVGTPTYDAAEKKGLISVNDAVQLVRRNDAGPWEMTKLGKVAELRPDKEAKQWALMVDDFSSEKAVEWGKTFDSEVAAVSEKMKEVNRSIKEWADANVAIVKNIVERKGQTAPHVAALEMVSTEEPKLRILIHPSTYPDYKGKWQATRVDAKGPVGHTIHNTWEEAVRSYSGEYTEAGPSNAMRHEFKVMNVRHGWLRPGEKPPSLHQEAMDEFRAKFGSTKGDHSGVMGHVTTNVLESQGKEIKLVVEGDKLPAGVEWPEGVSRAWLVPTEVVQTEPETFQFKMDYEEGTGAGLALTGTEEWEPSFAGVVVMYRYPDGRLSIVDGHQRLALAKQKKVGYLLAEIWDSSVYSTQEARAKAARRNIAMGTGTVLDWAKFIRDTGLNEADVRKMDVKSQTFRTALALSNLSEDVFQHAVNNRLELRFAAVIGQNLADNPDAQNKIAEEVMRLDRAGKHLDENIIFNMIRQAEMAGTRLKKQVNLFGEEEFAESLIWEASALEEGLRQRLVSDKNVVVRAVKGEDVLAQVGAKFDTEIATEFAKDMRADIKVFMVSRKYADTWVSKVIRKYAPELAGTKSKVEIQEVVNNAYEEIRDAIGKDAEASFRGGREGGLFGAGEGVTAKEPGTPYKATPERTARGRESLERLGVRKVFDTENPDPKGMGHAAIVNEGWRAGTVTMIHLTDNPDGVVNAIQGKKGLDETYSGVGELGPGLYGSYVPQLWVGRSKDKWSFLNGLNPQQKRDFYNAVLSHPNAQEGYITARERGYLERDMNYWLNGELGNGAIGIYADQPYNIRSWEPKFLKPLGIDPGKQPSTLPITLRGRFAEMKSYLLPEDMAELKEMGIDGAYHTGTDWGTIGQLVVWNKEAVVGVGNVSVYEAREAPSEYKATAPVFYSKLERVVEANLDNRGTGESFAKTLAEWQKGGKIKADELKWSGLIPWLEGEKSVTKEQVLEKLRENAIEVRVKAIGEEREKLMRERSALGNTQKEVARFNEITRELGYPENRPKFKRYMRLPVGGENYREFFFTLPAAYISKTARNVKAELERRYGKDWNEKVPAEERKRIERDLRTQIESESFKPAGAHRTDISGFDLNRWCHIFVEDRIINGERYLFIVEAQTEWGQKGRKEGFYLSEQDELRLESLKKEYGKVQVQYEAIEDRIIKELGFDPEVGLTPGDEAEFDKRLTPADLKVEERRTALIKEMNELEKRKKGFMPGGVPSFPFVKNWYEVAMKYMTRYAAENNYAGVAWVTGEMVRERYDLSKDVEMILINRKADGFAIQARLKGQLQFSHIADKIPAKDLSDYVPKEMADHAVANLTGPDQSWSYEGNDLKVGAAWAKRLYDDTLVSFMGKFGKQWGAKVADVSLYGGVQPEIDVRTGYKAGTYEVGYVDQNGWQPVSVHYTKMEALEESIRVRRRNYKYKGPIPSLTTLREFVTPLGGLDSHLRVQVRDILTTQEDVETGMSFKDAMSLYGSPELADVFGGKLVVVPPESVHAIPIPDAMKTSALTEGFSLFERKTKYKGQEPDIDIDGGWTLRQPGVAKRPKKGKVGTLTGEPVKEIGKTVIPAELKQKIVQVKKLYPNATEEQAILLAKDENLYKHVAGTTEEFWKKELEFRDKAAEEKKKEQALPGMGFGLFAEEPKSEYGAGKQAAWFHKTYGTVEDLVTEPFQEYANSHWMTPDGKITGKVGTHTESVFTAFTAWGFPREAKNTPNFLKFCRESGFVRIGRVGGKAQGRTTIQVEVYGPLTQQQFKGILRLLKDAPSVWVDLHGESGYLADEIRNAAQFRGAVERLGWLGKYYYGTVEEPAGRYLPGMPKTKAGEAQPVFRQIDINGELEAAYGSEEQALNALRSFGSIIRLSDPKSGVSGYTVSDSVKRYQAVKQAEFGRTGRVDLIGKKLTAGSEAYDIAVMAQALRNPSMEVMQVLFSKEGAVVGHHAWTSGNLTSINFKDWAGFVDWVKNTATGLEADKVHFVHNHPSGKSAMSKADEKLASMMRDGAEVPANVGGFVMPWKVPGIGGMMGEFITIDHDEFHYLSLIGTNYQAVKAHYKPTNMMSNWNRRTQVSDAKGLINAANALPLDTSRHIALVFTDNANKVNGVVIHDRSLLMGHPAGVNEAIKAMIKAHDATRVTLVAHTGDPALSNFLQYNIDALGKGETMGNWMMDVLHYDPDQGNFQSLRGFNEAIFTEGGTSAQAAYQLFEAGATYNAGGFAQADRQTVDSFTGTMYAGKKPAQTMLEKIKGLKDVLKTPFGKTWAQVYTEIVSESYPIEKRADIARKAPSIPGIARRVGDILFGALAFHRGNMGMARQGLVGSGVWLPQRQAGYETTVTLEMKEKIAAKMEELGIPWDGEIESLGATLMFVRGRAKRDIMRMARRLEDKLAESYTTGDIENVSESLAEAVVPLRDLAKKRGMDEQQVFDDLFKGYMGAERTLELSGAIGERAKTFKVGLEPQLAQETIAALERIYGDDIEVFLDVKERVRKWADSAILEPLVRSGRMSETLANVIRKSNKYYTPFFRVMSEMEEHGEIAPNVNIFEVKNIYVKEIKGSERAIIDPLEMLIRLSYNAAETMGRANVAQTIAELPLFSEAGAGIEVVRAKEFPVAVQLRQEIDPPLRKTLEEVSTHVAREIRYSQKLRKGTLGYFQRMMQSSVNAGEITEAEAGTLINLMFGSYERTLAHEMGHGIDHRYNLQSILMATNEMRQEIRAIADLRVPEWATPYYRRYARKRTEQMAEFVNHYITQNELCRQMAPQATAVFEDFLRNHEELVPLLTARPTSRASIKEMTGEVWVKSPFRPEKNALMIYRNGKPYWVKMPEDLFKACLGTNMGDMGVILKLCSRPAAFLRAGAVLSPEFISRNPIRDAIMAWVFARHGFAFHGWFKDFFKLMKSDKEAVDLWNKFQAGGGTFADLATTMIKMRDLTKDEIMGQGKNIKYFSHPLEALRDLSAFLENVTRFSVYRQAIKNGASHAQAVHEARTVTLDYHRFGGNKYVRALNMIIPFFNAGIQGVDKLGSEMADPTRRGRVLQKILMGITLPSILLWLLTHDDDRIKELEDWERNLFWHIPMGKDMPLARIPKPFEVGIAFGSIPERMLDFWKTNDEAGFKKGMQQLTEAMLPNMVPTVLRPGLEQMSNYNFFLDRPIEDESIKQLPVELRAKPWTSELAKAWSAHFGKYVGVSPVMFENHIRSIGGGLAGNYFLPMTDFALRKTGAIADISKPDQELIKQIPFVRALFSREPTGLRAKSANHFFEKYHDGITGDQGWKMLWGAGQMEEVDDFLKKHPEAMFARVLRKQMDAIGELKKARDGIYTSMKMSSAEKKAKLDRLDVLTDRVTQFMHVFMSDRVLNRVSMPPRSVSESGAMMIKGARDKQGRPVELTVYYKYANEPIQDAFEKLSPEWGKIKAMTPEQQADYVVKTIKEMQRTYQPIVSDTIRRDIRKALSLSDLYDQPTRRERAEWSQMVAGLPVRKRPGMLTGFRPKIALEEEDFLNEIQTSL